MVRLVLFIWALCSWFRLSWLVFMEMTENSRPVMAEITGSRKVPKVFQV